MSDYNNINSNMTNNYKMEGGVSTQLVHYDKPLFVVLGSGIYEMNAMMIVVTAHRNDKGRDIINTYRIPLTGKDLEPWEARDTDSLFILPEDKRLDSDCFRGYMIRMEDECDIEEAVSTLVEKNFVPVVEESEITVQVYYVNDLQNIGGALHSSWFNLHFSRTGDTWFKPRDIIGLCAVRQYLKKPFKFVPADPKLDNDCKLAENLTYLMEAFDKYGFYKANGKDVENDGTYTYSKDLGKIRMTREEFIEKFSDGIHSMID